MSRSDKEEQNFLDALDAGALQLAKIGKRGISSTPRPLSFRFLLGRWCRVAFFTYSDVAGAIKAILKVC